MRHNKKRNTALLYEFLIRHISKCLVENKKSEANATVVLLKEHFGSKTALRRELELFNHVFNSQVSTEQYAEKLLGEILSRAETINRRRLEEEKSALIKAINENYDASFYAQKIQNYVIYASVQMLISEHVNKHKYIDPIDRLKIEERVVHFLTEDKKKPQELQIDPKYSTTLYRIIEKKFNEKYNNTLNENQKRLLRKYALSMVAGKKDIFESAMKREAERVRSLLSFVKDPEIRKDNALMQKIGECRSTLNGFTDFSDKALVPMLQFISLADEVNL